MNKILTAYFSAGGATKSAALKIAKAAVTDIFEIEHRNTTQLRIWTGQTKIPEAPLK